MQNEFTSKRGKSLLKNMAVSLLQNELFLLRNGTGASQRGNYHKTRHSRRNNIEQDLTRSRIELL